MKKRILSMWLAVCVMMSLIVALPATANAASSGKCGDNVYWSLYDGTLTISGSGDMYDYSSSSDIPWYNSRSSVKKVVIKSGVTTIGDKAFSMCDSLTSVTIPNSVTTIGDGAFYDCDSLTSVTIPDSVTTIGESAFKDCKSLTNITVASNNPNYSALSDNLYNKDKTELIQYAIGKRNTSFIIPNSVKTIGYSAFSGCTSLASITIPDSVTTIGDGAFSVCKSLASITIPNSVTTIGASTFSGCTSLASITIPDSVTTIGDGAFSGCTSLASVMIPSSVKSIGSGAFAWCRNIKRITIPNGVTTIGDSTFSRCDSLTSITIPNSVTYISHNAFYGCKSLASITIPNSVTYISFGMFYGCESLTSIIIPESVTTIGNGAFKDCKSLTNITVASNNPNYSSLNGNLYNKYKTQLIQYAIGKKDTSFIIPDSVITIGDSAFYDCTNLTSVTIPDSVTTIGWRAFYDCDNLTSVTIGDRVTTIDYNAFYDCDSLTSVTIPNSVTTIDGSVFYDCDSLTSVTIGDSVTTIGDRAFEKCKSLTNITVASNNPNYSSLNGNLYNKYKTQLMQYAIGKKDTSFIIPDSVTTIGDYAFSYCRSLTSITIPDSVTTIGDYAFSNCDSLKDVYYSGTKEQWKKISIGGYNSYLTSAKIHYNSTGAGINSNNSKPYNAQVNTNKNGTTTLVSSSSSSKPYYSNAVKNNSSISGDYTIKDSDVTVSEGKSLNVSGKLTVENGNLYIEKGGKVTAQSIEIKTKGRISVNGELSTSGNIIAKGGSNGSDGGCIEVDQNATVSSGNVSLYDYAKINLYGKLYANSFLIKTKTNLSNFGSNGEMWLKGDFTQQKNGALWWQNGVDNFRPSSGFSVLFENNGYTHNISFDTPGQSYFYNLYSVTNGNTTAVWEGNPEIKGKTANVRKNSSGYTINKKDNEGSAAAAKDCARELEAIINGKSAVKISYGISEFGGMYSETNKALEKYLYAYTSGVEALYPSVIDVSVRTWEETMRVYYNGQYRKVKFTFEIANLFGNKVINVKYTYEDSNREQCFAFLCGNKNELANAIRKYATDTYNSTIAKCLMIDNIDQYVKNKKSNLADLLWQGVQNISVVGTPSGKKAVKSVVEKGLNVYLDKVEKAIGTSVCSADIPAFFGVSNEPVEYNDEFALLSENETQESVETPTPEPVETPAPDLSDTFTDTYLISALKEKLGTDELTQENLEAVEELDLSSSYITDLTGIGQCKNLKKLDLSGNAVSELTPISGLTDLQTLILSGNSVSDLKPIANLTNLQSLTLKSNLLTDLSGLENLSALTDLDLAFNTIVDISPLQNLVNIQRLNLTSNNISDISSLANCKDLKELYAGANKISDISALSDMVLEKLSIAQNKVSSIDCINVTDLSGLDISENDISDISVLADANTLSDLNIGGNAINDISAVAGKTAMTTLNISDNAIFDIESLAQLTSLTELNCANNNITDFSVLSNLLSLMSLDVSNNAIEDFTFVKDLTELQTIYASGCDLYSDDMVNLPSNVKELDVSSNSITDVEQFVSMNYLSDLNLSDNYVSDISEFSAITHNMSLNVNGNSVSADNVETLQSAMQNNDYSITVTNTTPPVALQNMYFMKDTAEVKTGDEFLQQVSVMPYNADSSALIWESSNADVAEVEKGIVKGKIPGQTTITAKTADGELSVSYVLTVVDDMIQKVSATNNIVMVSLKNISDKNYDSAAVVASVYDKDGIVQGIKTVSINNFVSGYTENDIQIPFDDIPTDGYVKVFLWNSLSDLEPLCGGREFVLSK